MRFEPISPDLPEVADVLVIGAGASGAVVVSELARRGFSTVCLEQGGWTPRSEFLGASAGWELGSQQTWHPNPNVRQGVSDYPIDVSQSDVNPLMYSGVGGSTILYGAHWTRATPSDFRVYTLDGVADDWPLTYEELAPFYERIDDVMGISGLSDDPAYPDGVRYPLPPLPLGRVGMVAARGMDKLGWHWWPATNAIASRRYRGRESCVRRGTCQTGCPEGAKATTDITHWPDAIADGARLVTGARVRELTTDANGLVDSAIYIDRDGRERRQRAHVVVLAANGIGTPRLLQLSTSARHPNGLANSSGQVGKRLMIHPYASVDGLYAEPLEAWLGPAGQTIISMEFYETDKSRGFVRGGKWHAMPTGGPQGHRSAYAGRPPADQWGTNFHHRISEVGRSFEWGVIAEDLPAESNQVLLANNLTDTDGIPAPKVIYKTSEDTSAKLAFHVNRMREAHLASGAISTSETSLMRDSGYHLLGTARMGDDPASSVVDSYGQSHDVPNLYILDGSTFVTSFGVNPTNTIMALALRGVEHMIKNRAQQKVATHV
ncbi:GMC family oxidoreductase [Saccharopolyspora spinosa]|uniref:Choline dehydrogenase-like flavoprotein n=1 Tax=Saccharopolyspora spinosa TaxID=60894 RepID=A0A2N3Y6E3_SACSN|nr:GMC family oxidoreductase [Saccharopolyspora spinosa]PKW18496.1 choline dehydrogenase-like flavoprotein [Saccharopolyspora spinosa]